jgi:RNA polymerase sigma-70 factor (ECF subfamily)
MMRLVAPPEVVAPPGAAGPPAGEPTDPLRALAAQAVGGDAQAQRTLVITLGPPLLRVVRSVLGAGNADVEDVLQEVMLTLCSALAGFRGECKTLHFACRVAVQVAMNARRRAGYRTRHTPSVPPEELAELSRDDLSPAELLAAARRREILRELVGELPPPQAEVLVLHDMRGYSVLETAETTAAPVNTVRSRLRGALAALRARVQGDPALRDAVGGEP